MIAALWLSLQVALMATAIATVLAVGVSAVLANRRVLLVDALLTTPMVLPPTVLGYGLLVAMGQTSLLGRAWHAVFGTPLVFTTFGIVVAAVVTSLPLIVQASRAAIEGVDLTLIQASRTLGLGPIRTFLKVTLPLASRGISAGIVLGFARALGDFGVTLMVGGNLPGETRTASLALYDAFIDDRSDEALQLTLLMAGLAVLLVSVATLLGRRPHA
jgi:molybdate transport system permease protein